MRKTLIWLGIGAIAFGAYVLGAKAGRGRYREIRQAADVIWNDPRFKKMRAKAAREAATVGEAAMSQVKKMGR